MTVTDIDGSAQPARRRVLGTRDIVLFTVSTVLVVDQLPATAAIGPGAMGWWVVMILFYVLPFAMIAAELGSAWPSQGGIYVWIRHAFGDAWGSRTAFYYWISLSIWMPSAALLTVSMAGQLFGRAPGVQTAMALALALVWISVVLSCLRTEVGRWIPNIGALIKIAVLLCVGGIGVLAWWRGPTATPLTLATMAPSYGAALQFLPVLVYNLFGFELIASAGGEIRDPARQLPRAMILSSLIVGLLYLFATFGMLAALPAGNIILDEGLIATLRAGFGVGPGGEAAVLAIGLALVFTLLTTMVTWMIGLNRLVQEAALSGDLPALFAYSNPRHGTPIGANICSGVVATVVLLALPASPTVEALFWNLVSLCSVVFLVPYGVMFLAFLKLRAAQPDQPRPFRVPGGKFGAYAAAGLSLLFVVQAAVLFTHVPGEPVNWPHTGVILVGLLFVLIAGELIRRKH